LKNKNKNTAIENLEIEIIPDEGMEDKMNWFEIINYAETKNKITIDKIEASTSKKIAIKITPPIDTQKDESFLGRILLKSNTLSENKEYLINLVVSKAPNISLKLSKTNLRTDCDSTGCTPLKFPFEKVSLQNTGTIDLSNILISIDTTESFTLCQDWFDPQEKIIPELKAGESVIINMILTPTYQNEEGHSCYLKWAFINPITQSQEVILSEPLTISLNYRET
jgi:uncharacterized membrane protein